MVEARLTGEQILALLPQQRPFRFVDRIIEVDENYIVGEYTFRKDEMFYAGHFPGRPVTPGVILLESMCQVGVVALGIYIAALETPIEEVSRHITMFTDAETEFFEPVFPEDTVVIKSEKIFLRRRKMRSKIQMYKNDGLLVAQATASGIGVQHD